MRKLPLKLKVYIFIIYLSAGLLFLFSFKHGYLDLQTLPQIKDILFFGIISAFTDTLAVYYKNMSFSTTFAITSSVFIIYGPLTAIITVIIGHTFRVLKVNNRYKHILNTPFYGTLFNYSILSISLMVSTILFVKSGGEFKNYNIISSKFPIIVFFLSMFLTNNFIISIMSSLTSSKKFLYSFLNNIRLMSLNILAMGPLGIMLAYVFDDYDWIGVIMILFPIILARYTFYLYIQAKTQYIDTVDVLMKAIEARDQYTEGHSQRVGDLAVKIAKLLKYNEWKIEDLKIASMLHDVGKIGVRDHILNKPGKLDVEEFEIIKSHPEKGYNILKNIKNLEHILHIVRHHHERYDGKGYPDGKGSDELSLDVFIVQLADSIDAMATDRPYRKALSKEIIIEEVKRHSGTQFHPKVVEAYLKVVENEENVRS